MQGRAYSFSLTATGMIDAKNDVDAERQLSAPNVISIQDIRDHLRIKDVKPIIEVERKKENQYSYEIGVDSIIYAENDVVAKELLVNICHPENVQGDNFNMDIEVDVKRSRETEQTDRSYEAMKKTLRA